MTSRFKTYADFFKQAEGYQLVLKKPFGDEETVSIDELYCAFAERFLDEPLPTFSARETFGDDGQK